MQADSQIYKTVQRSNTTTIIFSLIALAAAGALAFYFFVPYWTAKLSPSRVMTAEEILELDEDTTLYNVTIEGNRMRDTYYYEETIDQDTGRQMSIDAYFGALRFDDDNYILVRHPEEIDRDIETYTGTIMPITSSVSTDVHRLAADELNIDLVKGIMLDTTESDGIWYFGTAGVVILGLGGVWGLFNFVTRSSNPAKHPTLRRLARFGEVEQVVDSIEKDLTNGEDKVAKLRLSKNWLIDSGGSKFEAMPYHSLVWGYKMIQQGRYGKTYFAHFYDKTGVGIVIQDNENNVNMMLQAVYARAPWAVFGYSNDIKRNWDKNRAGFIAEVEARQSQSNNQYSQ